MALDLVTGYKGTAHITAEDVGAFNAGIFGSGEYVLNSGNKFSASLTSNNTVKILDGDLMMQGRHVTLKKDTFEEVTIENGESGMNRIDLIVARYTKDSNTGVENVEFAVVKGTPTSGTATAPECTTGDILSGDCTLHEMPLYKVSLSGLTAGNPEAMFEVANGTVGISKNSIVYRGDDVISSPSKDTPAYWAELGSGAWIVPTWNLKGVTYRQTDFGTLISYVFEDSLLIYQFYIGQFNGVLYRVGKIGETNWNDSGGTTSPWCEVKLDYQNPVVTGTYTGDEKAIKKIELGFKPSAVLVARSDGSMVRSHWGSGLGTYFYGGLAVNGSNCLFWDGETDTGVVTLDDDGFTVYYVERINDMSSSANGYIHTNSKSKFHYVAFRF